MRRPAREHWFTAAQFETAGCDAEGRAGGAQGWIAHAKQMGTNLTACGENAFTWSKLWHVRFDQAGPSRCPACVDAVAIAAVRSATSLQRTTFGAVQGSPGLEAQGAETD